VIFFHCAAVADLLPHEQKTTAVDVAEESRPKLDELLMEGMVVGAGVEQMKTLTRLLLTLNQRRLVRHFLLLDWLAETICI